MPTLTLRITSLEDKQAITELLKVSYETLMPPAYDEETLAPILPLITKANPTLLGSGTYYVVETNTGEAVGCGGWTQVRPGNGEKQADLGHIRHFATHPDWTRRGVGSRLFDRSREDAFKAGIKAFECYSSLNGEAFYRSCGFKRLELIGIPITPELVLPSVRMKALLR